MLYRFFSKVGILFTAFLIPILSVAYYIDKPASVIDQPEISRIIVKLPAESKIKLSTGVDGMARTGLEAVDNIATEFSIRQMELLLPDAVNARLPDNLKNLIVIQIPEKADLSEIVAKFEKLPEIEYAHPDWPLELYETPNDSLYGEQWALNNIGQGCRSVIRIPGYENDTLGIIYGSPDADIDFQEVYDNPPDQTETAVVAIIDTGVDTDHPDLVGRIWTNPGEIPDNGLDDDHNGYIDDVHGWDFSGGSLSLPPIEDNDITDPHGHGTHCSGIVAAVTDNLNGIAGINYDCRIMGLKFYPNMFTSFAARAIIYAADNGADVISMSWGTPWVTSVLENALSYARSKGVILCAAAGNDGYEAYNYPAAISGVITVGATQWEDKVTTFSTYGSHLNICAPGQSILSLRADSTDMYSSTEAGVHIIDNIYYLASGTSMACPHVAAVAAFMRSVSPGLTPDAAEDVIEGSADDLTDPYGDGSYYPGWDIYSGYGRLNLSNALNSVPKIRALIETPLPNSIAFGELAISGIADGADFANYQLEYGVGSSPTSWTQIVSSTIPVTHDLIAQWNTTGLDGIYTLRLKVGDDNASLVTVLVANDISMEIIRPVSGDTITTTYSIVGSAYCRDFDHFILDYRPSTSPENWTEIVYSSRPIFNDEMANWDTNDLPKEWYYLRLRLFSDTGQVDVDSTMVYVRSLFSYGDNWKLANELDVTPCPNFCDIDNDGNNEIILGRDGDVLFINPDGTLKTDGVPVLPPGDYRVPAAVGNLDNDGHDDFVICNETHIYGFPSSAPSFEITLSTTPRIEEFESGEDWRFPCLSLKDVDSDGMDEILLYAGAQSLSPRYCVYESDGSPIVEVTGDYGTYQSADLDGDGQDEIYMTYEKLYQASMDGTILDSFDLEEMVPEYGNCKYLSPVDIDADGKFELIVTAIGDNYFWIYAFDENLSPKEGWPRNTSVSSFLVPSEPVFVDMDRDGLLEYFITSYELIEGTAYGWRIDGTPLSGDSLNPLFAAAPHPARLYDPVFADVDGDGFPELIASAGANVMCDIATNRLIAWNNDAEIADGWPITVAADNCFHTRRFTPTVGDINGDGDIDVMMTTIENELIFLSFDNIPYSEETSPAPFWRYNRRVNNCGPIFRQICGDANLDGLVNIFDISFIINYLYISGPPPVYPDMIDVNSDGNINIFDIVYLIQYLYLNGAEPNCG